MGSFNPDAGSQSFDRVGLPCSQFSHKGNDISGSKKPPHPLPELKGLRFTLSENDRTSFQNQFNSVDPRSTPARDRMARARKGEKFPFASPVDRDRFVVSLRSEPSS